MAGHSKWANIQHRKKAQDAKRGKIFTKLIREVTVAARMGGPDPSTNPRLRLAIDKAFGMNMPKDNLERAIKRGAGLDSSVNYEQIRYEGYGPGGTAVLVDCMTDNRNRTVSEVRHAFSKCGGNLGTDGCVAYLFKETGVFTFAPGSDEDRVMEVALEAGAEDIVNHEDGSLEVLTGPGDYHTVKDALEAAGLEAVESEVTMRPDNTVDVDGDDAVKTLRLLEMLEDLDDVQNVYSNAEISEEAYAQS
ncbi:YebC/PmpR family DNA-binding transcriptional regulator [Alkalilimnicola ehrlichii]|uniref:Probable transcriptional regulatory protein CAL65_00765 n=1 Tax=Alkalilimnicola ehrlichii TaxID=351052 RepID=A0A3E0X3F5_9GAMM|nr:YebC/PmpR family DNA-binding transcriptional regulator [Alkalilimnicola ehrlichii]RFA31495.1 YebC/PmpR family DNA-binding transcriptional regulator [Alkalilimnicola ehrlichii]RFA39372.1 YebC/PmpR family DNA-binding transcriptional regulator [Alkalilimnicola ehrlichii]